MMNYCDLWDYSNLSESERLREIQSSIWKFFCDDVEKYGLIEREGQQNMALDIGDAIENKHHLIVEAGVGIGKSFAYIVPLLIFHKHFKRPIIISSSTITLQEQLVDDIMFISEKINYPIQIVVAKGQTHYICSKRVNELRDVNLKERILSEMALARFERKEFADAAINTHWDEICINNYGKKNCRNCIYSQSCQFALLRKEMRNTKQIVVCNHDLLTVHLQKTKWGGNGLLPENSPVMVVDEAHNLEDKVRSSLTSKYTKNAILSTAKMAANTIDRSGTSIDNKINVLSNTLTSLYGIIDSQVLSQIESKQEQVDTGRFFFNRTPEIMNAMNRVAELLNNLSNDIQAKAGMVVDRYGQSILTNQQESDIDNLFELLSGFDILCNDINSVIWIEKPFKSKSSSELCICPGDIPNRIRQLYFDDSHISILTSATLTNQKTGSCSDMYSYLMNNIGFPQENTDGIPGYASEPKLSPFPYDDNAMIYYATDLPHPTKDRESFLVQGSARVIELLKLSGGRALVLFTSKSDMNAVYEQLKGQNLPYTILKANEGASQEYILSKFREEQTSVLLGTGAFWEGINIVGDALTNVIIFRLPFPVPDPIIKSKCDKAQNALLEVLTPEMIIKLNQGIGRLIRSETDIGIISIVDPRLSDVDKAPYTEIVWESLPIKSRTSDLTVLSNFYSQVILRRAS